MFCFSRKFWVAGLSAVLAVSAFGGFFGASPEKDRALADLKQISADKWSIVGRNIVAEGNVQIPYGQFHVSADRAVVNIESRDIEAVGNIRLFNRLEEKTTITPQRLAELQRHPDTVITIDDVTFNPLGETALNVTIVYMGDSLTAQKLSGNLITGYFTFDDVSARMKNLAFRAKSGVRNADGNIQLKDAEASSCEYLTDENAHYSVSASSAEIFTHQNNGFGISGYNFEQSEHSMLAKNAVFRIYGVPVFWLPYVYKPKDQSLHLFHFNVGSTGDWGFFLSLSKQFQLTDYPYSSVTLLADYYEKRGFGYGADVNVATENSKTEILAYSIYDTHQYESSEVQDERLLIPHFRYGVHASNVTHLTPSTDFRANVDFMSDLYFQHDYFRQNYNNNPEPATFAALEQQFERATLSLYARMRVNDFITTAQHLPEFRIDMPRQELFGTNIYYQGEHSLSYLQMKWRDFDRPRWTGNRVDPADYSTMRLDTVNFLYYPINLDWLNLVPRAGVRLTYYSDSSEREIDASDLQALFLTEMPQGVYNRNVYNYDKKGGGRARFIGEFGFEASTKIYNTWQNVRSAVLGLDGLRHVMVPYINYTYLTNPSEDREHLYYFDDVDRITTQNFFRFGLQNRLQTRRNDGIASILRMENYFDLFLQKEDGYRRLGDFCTKLTMEPLKGMTISTLFSINTGGGGNDRPYANGFPRDRWSKNDDGGSRNWLNRWVLALRYEPVEDFVFNLSYAYQNSYSTRSAYSMGSSLSDLESGMAFDRNYLRRTQQIIFGIGIPLTPDRRTRASYEMLYDFEASMLRTQRVAIRHQMHCVELALLLSRTADFDRHGNKDYDNSISGMITFSGVTNPVTDRRGKMPSAYRNYARNSSIGSID